MGLSNSIGFGMESQWWCRKWADMPASQALSFLQTSICLPCVLCLAVCDADTSCHCQDKLFVLSLSLGLLWAQSAQEKPFAGLIGLQGQSVLLSCSQGIYTFLAGNTRKSLASLLDWLL